MTGQIEKQLKVYIEYILFSSIIVFVIIETNEALMLKPVIHQTFSFPTEIYYIYGF